jgi:hypothetical protein
MEARIDELERRIDVLTALVHMLAAKLMLRSELHVMQERAIERVN